MISLTYRPKFRRKAVAVFTVSSGNREKIMFIQLILSEKLMETESIHTYPST